MLKLPRLALAPWPGDVQRESPDLQPANEKDRQKGRLLGGTGREATMNSLTPGRYSELFELQAAGYR